MVKLPSDFKYEKYGVTARLVTEDDAEFIVKLRSDIKLSRFIHASNGDVNAQKQWIRNYKERERQGIEYYFIFFRYDNPFGLERIYNIDWIHLSYTSGSWICVPNLSNNLSVVPVAICQEIAFERLGLLIDLYEVRKDNVLVVKFHVNIMKAIKYGENDSDYLFMINKETRKKSLLNKLIKDNY